MGTRIWLAVAVFFSLFSIQSAHADIVSTFDSDSESWTLDTSTTELTWASSGGNPDGYLRFADAVQGAAFVIAPTSYHGDWGTLYEGGSLSFDHKVFQIGNGPAFNTSRIEISGSGGSAFYLGSVFADEDWVTRSVSISELDWNVASGTWADLLNDVTDLRIQIEGVSNNSPTDINGIDNVRLTAAVPEPSSFAMCCSLAAVCLIRRRRT